MVYFSPLHQFDSVRSTSVHFSQFWSNSVYFNSIRSTWPTLVCSVPISVYFGQFDHIQSILSNSVHLLYISPIWPIRSLQSTPIYSVQFGPYGPLRSIRSCLIHLVLFDPFSPLWSIRSIWSISDYFSPSWCTYIRMAKYKFGLRILLII